MFHMLAIFSRPVAALEYDSTYPVWRHVVFIVIDSSLVFLFLRRPAWLRWAFAALTVQILNGHGRAVWTAIVQQHRIDWISVTISIAAPAALAMLFLDTRSEPTDLKVRLRARPTTDRARGR